MSDLQPQSSKIRKKARNCKVGKRTYVCGGCEKAYKSYPALYLHIKLKHEGIKPPNTTCQKPIDYIPPKNLPIGLSQHDFKDYDIDDIDDDVLEVEKAEDDLLRLLGDKMKLINPLDPKPSLDILSTISCNFKSIEDEDLFLIQQKIEQLIVEEKNQIHSQKDKLNFDLEIFKVNPPKDDIMKLSWLFLWLCHQMIKMEFFCELCFIFSRIWKVVRQMGIKILYVAEKMVWSEISKECIKDISKLPHFKGRDRLVTDFIKKLCLFIGKSLE